LAEEFQKIKQHNAILKKAFRDVRFTVMLLYDFGDFGVMLHVDRVF